MFISSRLILYVMAATACGVFVGYFWRGSCSCEPAAKTLPAAVAPVLKAAEQVAITPPVVRVYAPKAKTLLKLPATTIADPSVHVVTASRLPADERPQTLITLLDERTGETEAISRAEPLPWLAPETRGELGISYGIRDGMPVGRLSLRQNLLQIKVVRIGAQANLDHDGQWFAGLGAWYRW